jgi:hypothetical protein
MSTQKRQDSSRANGAKSRGPVTPEGRARSRAARLTNGLTSGVVVLSFESDEEYNALREEYLAHYQPQTRPQLDLVDHLVATRWRLNRVISLQSALMELQMQRQQPEIDKEFQGCGPDIRAAIAYQHLCDDSCALESLHRHETRLSAELRRTIRLLSAELKNQKFHHEPSDAKPKRSDEDGGAAEAPPSAIDHPPSTSSDDPDREPPPIPPAASTDDGQPATTGAPLVHHVTDQAKIRDRV